MPDAPAPPTALSYVPATSSDAGPQRRLSLFDSICIIVGVIIGAGIFKTGDKVAGAASGPTVLAMFWLVGGVVSLMGALCYAELTTAYPRDGGEYVFLSRAFGVRTGFLFAWCGFWIV